jgi:hypothetical protein
LDDVPVLYNEIEPDGYGSTKLPLAMTIELTIPEDGVARDAPASTVEIAGSVNKKANRLLVITAKATSEFLFWFITDPPLSSTHALI